MEHKTKFKVGETAWFLRDNKVHSGEVRGMCITYQIGWYYGVHSSSNEPLVELELGSSGWGGSMHHESESRCFHSKKELLNNL